MARSIRALLTRPFAPLPPALALLALVLAPAAALAQEFVVDAGEDVVLECESAAGSSYTLNGSVPEGPDVTFSWSTAPPVSLADDDTLTPTGLFPIGETLVTLDATDPVAMLSGSDSVSVTVEDSEPPVVQVMANPSVLWPPNHQMRQVQLRVRSRDRCSDPETLAVELVSVESNEPDNGLGDGNTTNDIQAANLGTDDRQVLLRAERSGRGDGRVYTLVYRVTDAAGNQTEGETKVYVPHDYSDVRDRIMDEMDGDRDDMDNICPRPDVATEEFIDALPELASFASRDDCIDACRTWNRGCNGIAGGSARCVYSEERALMRLERTDCDASDSRSEQRECRREQRRETRSALAELREQYREANATCDDVARRCANACETLFDPNGSDWDDEGIDE